MASEEGNRYEKPQNLFILIIFVRMLRATKNKRALKRYERVKFNDICDKEYLLVNIGLLVFMLFP
jgi:hypothetical protein